MGFVVVQVFLFGGKSILIDFFDLNFILPDFHERGSSQGFNLFVVLEYAIDQEQTLSSDYLTLHR